MSWPTAVVLVLLMICIAEIITASLIWGQKPAPRKPDELDLHDYDIEGFAREVGENWQRTIHRGEQGGQK